MIYCNIFVKGLTIEIEMEIINMRKNDNWIQKTFRIRPEAISLYMYLEYYIDKTYDIPAYRAFDEIIEYSISHIAGNNIDFVVSEFNSKRSVKGFTISKKNLDLLKKFFSLNKGVKKGQIIEIMIALYAAKHLSEEELSKLKTYMVIR